MGRILNQIETDLRHSMAYNAVQKLPYYKQWLFDNPIIISRAKYEQSVELQRIFFKLINEFVNHYDEYKRLMPLSADVQKIIDIWQQKNDYEIGTYRTDFVLDDLGNFRPIEITCRFALNGYFLPSILNQHANMQISDKKSDYYYPYQSFPSYFTTKLKQNKRVVVLRDRETKNESKLFEPILQAAGLELTFLTVNDLNSNQHDFDNCLVINEFTFDELLEIDEQVHRKLSTSNFMNDLRTVFLIHDKRFFAAINDAALQHNCLTPEEIGVCNALFVPSEIYSADSEQWQSAKHNKDQWVLKHRALGKSQAVFAGIVIEESEWAALFNRNDISEFVLQKWIPQKTFSGSIKEMKYNDYYTGTFLFCDKKHFGFAEFRTSSFPVTNKVDHRKCVSLIVADDQSYSFDSLTYFNNIGLV